MQSNSLATLQTEFQLLFYFFKVFHTHTFKLRDMMKTRTKHYLKKKKDIVSVGAIISQDDEIIALQLQTHTSGIVKINMLCDDATMLFL